MNRAIKAFFLLALISLNLHGQHKSYESNFPLAASPIVEQFISDGLDFDFYARHHIDTHLHGIYFLPKEKFRDYLNIPKGQEKAAHIGKRRGEWIIIVDITFKDSAGALQVILYHELGHLFGLEHDETIRPAIMNATRYCAKKLAAAVRPRIGRTSVAW